MIVLHCYVLEARTEQTKAMNLLRCSCERLSAMAFFFFRRQKASVPERPKKPASTRSALSSTLELAGGWWLLEELERPGV